MQNTQKKKSTSQSQSNSLSASSAYKMLPESIKKSCSHFINESNFRKFLQSDSKKENVFNVKMYTLKSQTRFVITAADFTKGLEVLKSRQ